VIEFNKAILDCMRELRRRLREEQALDIHFRSPTPSPKCCAPARLPSTNRHAPWACA
jgi:hypothetical protein